MNSGTITNQLLDAVQVLVDDAVKKAEFDRTVQAVIVKCVSATKGKYSVKYQGGYFYAYAQDPDVTYSPDTQVYVLIPGNDMNTTKTILGTVDKLGEDFVSTEEASVYGYIGNNICSDDEEALYGLHSYLVTDNIVLYEDGETSENSFNINADAANLYLKNSDYLVIAAKFRTNLPQENRIKGNYGLRYILTFDDPLTGTEVDRNFTLDINSMIGNPYNQPVSTRQHAEFYIDSENFKKIKKIELFSNGFVTTSNDTKPADIFVSGLEMMGAVLLPADEGSGYVLNLITKQGVYFDENDSSSATRKIEAEIYKNKELQQVTAEDVAYYWFKANDAVFSGDVRWLKYGGNQWECINEYTTEEGTGRRIYKTNKSSIEISKQSTPAQENHFKCVVVYKDSFLTLEREVILYNKSSNYSVNLTCSEEVLTAAATATLTCAVSGVATGHSLSYYWSQKLDDDTYFSELGTTNVNTYDVNLKQPLQMVTYKCFVKDVTDNKDIGSATIFITRGEEEFFNSYYVVINSDMQVFKYDTDGNSPTSQTLLNPQTIMPLSFALYDPEGVEIPASEIGASNINWIYPTENTMLTNIQETGTYDEQLNFEIKNKYDPTAVDNTIKLEINYDDKTIRAKANLIFLKEGENGSNGTAYYLKVEPNLSPNTTIKGKVYYYYKDNSHKGFNFTYPNGQFPFKTLFYRDGDLIYDSSSNNNEITPTVSYDFVKRTYTKINNNLIQDNCNFIIDGNNITCVTNPAIGTSAGNYDADILRCTFQYDGLTWYYMYPIIFIKYNASNSANYEIIIPQESGFDEVVFTEDGRNPIYRGNNEFEIEVAKSGEKISTSEVWSIQGQIYTSNWQEKQNLLIKTETSGKKFYSKESYDGNCVTNAYYCVVSEGADEVAKIHFPIAMYLNTYGNAYVNEWNGNAIELNEEGGIILTPQIAAGQKENDNTFTGVVAGKAKESTSSTFDEGIFGYNHGERTFELNAEDGSARFGKTGAGQIVISPDETNQHSVLQSGNYVAPVIDASGNIIQAGEGLQIDLTEPSIIFGSGKFRVDSDGSVHATEYALTANLINGDYDIPSAAIQVDNHTSLADYVSTTDSALEDLQDQIDGNISTWFYAYEPTLSNEPASTWTTTTEKDNHLGDLFYDTTTGYCYRFMKTGSTYSWGQLSDSDIAEALAAAQAAQDTADNKRRVFVTTPTPPYDIGDLWVEGSTGDIKKCKTAKTSSQSYNANDWEKASKYTDDTTINTLKPNLVTSTIVEYALGTSSSTAPSSGWNQVAPEWESGKYMWQRTTTIYADDTQQSPHRVTSDPTCLTGATGRGISSTQIRYVADNQGTTPPADSANWQNSPPEDAQGQYVWTRTRITYTDGQGTTTSYSVSYKGIDGQNGQDGQDGTSVTITSQNIKYGYNNSGTDYSTVPATRSTQNPGGWDTTIPNTPDGYYLWTKTTVNYSDGNSTVGYSASYQSADGFSLWTTNVAPTNNTYARNQLTGPTSTQIPRVGEIIIRSARYQYPITAVNSSNYNVTVGTAVDLKAVQYYTYVRYASSAQPAAADISTDSTGKTYMGVAVTTSTTAPTVYTSYTWTKFVGEDGHSAYNYIRYSQYDDGHNMVETPSADTKYIGLYSGTSSEVPAYTEFNWSKFVGDDATQYYTHLMYATDDQGTGISPDSSGKTYIGIRVDEVETASTNPSDYTWTKFVGDDGTDGINGTNGFSLWIANVAPTNNIYTRSQLTGPSATQVPRVNEIIIRSNRYQYNIQSVSGNNITVNNNPVDLKGADGTNGTSIIWKGDLSSAPSNPQTLWAYYNTTDKKTYIYNGTSWEIMAVSGANGQNATQYYYHVVYCDDPSDGTGYSTSANSQLYTGSYTDTQSADAEDWATALTKNIKWNYTKGADGQDGVDATNIICGNEAQTIMCTTEGKVAAATTITIPFAGYIGNSRAVCSVVASDLPNGISVTSNTAATTSADGSLVLTAVANSTLGGSDTGNITLTFTCNSKTFVKKFAWSKNIPGATGPTGATGTGIESITEQYYLSTSKDSPTGGSWVETAPTWENGKYIWTRSKIVYKNPASTVYTTELCSSEWEAVNAVQDEITDKETHYNFKYHLDVVVYGDSNKFYPVCIKYGDQDVKRTIMVKRGYSEQAPADWNTATHKGALTLKILTNFGGWGGTTYSWEISEFQEQYSDVFGGAAFTGQNTQFALFLRGGGETGAKYHLYSDMQLDRTGSYDWDWDEDQQKYVAGKLPSPQIAYNSDRNFGYSDDSGATLKYSYNAPAPRGMQENGTIEAGGPRYRRTAAQNEEIRVRNYVKLTQDTDKKVVKQTTVEYYLSTSSVTTTGGSWVTTMPQRVDNKYMWTRQKITYSDNTSITGTATCIDNISGGRNLLVGTASATGDVATGGGTVVENLNLFGGLTGVKTNTAWAERHMNLKKVYARNGFRVGDTLTASVYVKADSATTQNFNIYRACNTSTTAKSINLTTEWQQLYFTFIADSYSTTIETTRIECQAATNSNYIYWAGWKLEKGNVPSDWSPAPEDTDASIIALNTYVDQVKDNLQGQIDGAIQFWNGANIPTLNNYPASDWTTEDMKIAHQADIYTVIQDVSGELKQGKSYRFDKVNNTWQWIELTDNELSAVQALASSKAKVFVTTPTVPYSIGDLWLKDGDLYRCKTAKDSSGSYALGDWELATNYTDDSAANAVQQNLDNLKIGGTNIVSNRTSNWSNGNWSIPAVGAKPTLDTGYPGRISLKEKISIEPNTEYWIKIYSTKNVNALFRELDVDGNFIKSTIGMIDQKWISPSDCYYVNLTIYENSAIDDITNGITKIKFEKGNRATDWSPAPEDAPKTLDVEYYLSDYPDSLSGGSWQTQAPTWVDGKYMWSRQKLTYGDGTVETKNQTCIAGAKGATGTAGANTAMVYLYGRFATAPSSKPYSAAVTYTFSTGALSSIPSGWSQTIPSGTNPLYVSTAIASSNTTTASIAANKWTTPTKFAQDGSNGTNGISVVSIIPLYYLTISATTPAAPSTNHDNESTYPNPDIDVWTKFMPDYRTQDFYDLEKYASTTEFPEVGEEGTIYQAGANNYYIWDTEATPNAYTSVNTFYCYDKTTTKYYYKATGANPVEINQRYRYFTCEEAKYSNGNHTWTSVIENKELDSLFNQTEAMQSSIDVTNTVLNTAQNDIDELQRKNETQDTLNESFRSDIDNNFKKTIVDTYSLYKIATYGYTKINANSSYQKDLIYYKQTSEGYKKLDIIEFNDYWVNENGDGSNKKLIAGKELWIKTTPTKPSKPTAETENNWIKDIKPQWTDGHAIFVSEAVKYGDNSKQYSDVYLLTDYQTIDDNRYIEAADVYSAMRGSNNIFYNSNGFFVYDKKTEDESTKRIVINQNGINFATRLRFKEASNPDTTNYPGLYYVKEKDLNIYYTIENVGKNYNDTSKYENRNNNVIIYEKDETTSGAMGWDTTSAWGIQGNLNLNKIEVINLRAEEITDGVLTLGTTQADGKLLIQNDDSHQNFEISTQHLACPIFNNSTNPQGYIYIGQDIGIQCIDSQGKPTFGNPLIWTSLNVEEGVTYINNTNYYWRQGDITSLLISNKDYIEGANIKEVYTNVQAFPATGILGTIYHSTQNGKDYLWKQNIETKTWSYVEQENNITNLYTCSCKSSIFDVINQRVVGDITFVNNNTSIIKTITLNFTTNGIVHQGLGFIKG